VFCRQFSGELRTLVQAGALTGTNGSRRKFGRLLVEGRTSIDSTFSPIHLAGHYLYLPCDQQRILIFKTHCLSLWTKNLFQIFNNKKMSSIFQSTKLVIWRILTRCGVCLLSSAPLQRIRQYWKTAKSFKTPGYIRFLKIIQPRRYTRPFQQNHFSAFSIPLDGLHINLTTGQ
jgi:hypothetical protein